MYIHTDERAEQTNTDIIYDRHAKFSNFERRFVQTLKVLKFFVLESTFKICKYHFSTIFKISIAKGVAVRGKTGEKILLGEDI